MEKQSPCHLFCPAFILTLLTIFYIGAVATKPVGAETTVALLRFEAPDTDFGRALYDLVSSGLSEIEDIALVERADLDQIVHELGLNSSGFVSDQAAGRLGEILGAQILVTGRTITTGKHRFFTAKIIGTETGRMFSETVKTGPADDWIAAVHVLNRKIAERIKRDGGLLRAGQISAIQYSLKAGPLPAAVVDFREIHIPDGSPGLSGQQLLTEILHRCGIRVFSSPDSGAGDTSFDILCSGEARSEFVLKQGELFTCKAVADLKILDARTREILAAASRQDHASDISERLAAEEAVRKTVADLAGQLIAPAVEKWRRSAQERQK